MEGKCGGSKVDPSTLEVLDSSRHLNPAMKNCDLKIPWPIANLHSWGDGKHGLQLKRKISKHSALVDWSHWDEYNTGQRGKAHGTIYSSGNPAAMENFMRGIDEISRPDGDRRFRIENLLKNFEGKVLSL
jgi:hypothetical protein